MAEKTAAPEVIKTDARRLADLGYRPPREHYEMNVAAELISMAIARRIGYGKKIILGDKNLDNAKAIAETMNNAGFDAVPFTTIMPTVTMIMTARNMNL